MRGFDASVKPSTPVGLKEKHIFVCVFDRDSLQECHTFISRIRKATYVSEMKDQKIEFNR